MRFAGWIGLLASVLALVACDSTRPIAVTGGAGGQGSGGGAGASGGAGGEGPEVDPCNVGMPLVCNPYGVDLEVPSLTGDAYWSAIADGLRVPYYQPAPIVLEDGALCDHCTEAVKRGLRLVLPVRPNPAPSVLPPDMSMYQALLGELLDAHQAAVGAVVIDGGPDLPGTWGGTLDEYLTLLAAGCAAAHAKGVRCTDGGLSTTTMVFLLADFELAGGDAATALKLVTLADGNPEVKAAFATWPPTTEADLVAALATQKARLDTAKKLLASVRAAGVDYPNFHWWERDQDSLDHAIAFMRNQTGCNAVASTNLGQRTQDHFEAWHKADDAKELGLQLVIWSSRHADGAAPLVDETGALTDNGAALAMLSGISTCLD